jgi:hypothetical protein
VTIAFYLDEDAMRISLRRALQSCNFDVQSAFEAGMVRRPDEEQLEVATDQGRVLYSFNVADFSRIHADWLSLNRPHAGIVLAHQWQRYSIGTQLRGLLRLSTERNAAGMRNRLEFLSDWI